MNKNTARRSRDFRKLSAADFCSSFDTGVIANDNIPMREVAECLLANRQLTEADRPARKNKRLWESLSDDEIEAVEKIYYGFQMLVSSGGYKTQSFSPVVVRRFERTEHHSDLVELFTIWARRAARDISVTSVLDVLVFGKSFRDIDREKQKRKGFAKNNLLEGVGIYINLFGRQLMRE